MSTKCTRQQAGDEGYATIAAVGIIGAVASLLLVVAAVVSTVAARHEGQVAADLAAVAGAFALARGGDGCAQSREVAGLNGAELTHCRIEELDVVVSVSVRRAEATARAGPA